MNERSMNASIDVIKIIAFEAEPVVDKFHSYTLIFSVDKSNIRWKVTHQFSRFKILNLLIRKLAPKLIYSKFPKDGTTTLLGLRLSKKAVDNRRLMLEIWIREVVANFEILPEEIAQSLNDFVKAPKRITTQLERAFSSSALIDCNVISAVSQSFSGRKHSADAHHLPSNMGVNGKGTQKDSRSSSLTKSKSRSRVETLARFINSCFVKIVLRISRSFESINEWDGTSTICLSRTDRMIHLKNGSLKFTFMHEMHLHLINYIQFYLVATFLNQTVGFLLYWLFGLSLPTSGVVFVTSFIMYMSLLHTDYKRVDEQPTAHYSSCAKVQDSLRKFLNSPSLEYTDKIYTFPSFLAYQNSASVSSKSDSSSDTFSSSDDHLGVPSSDDSPFRNSPEDYRPFAQSTLKDNTEKREKLELHESLVPGSTFDSVEFNDLCPEARAMFSDRSETHSMKVRGESYCEDHKKVNPGHAMSRLLLLELYEVEAKDGDRHDHIVSRGAARRRLQALRTLPEKLFFVCVNFQIPGDPPVSIVSYFGLPMDLMDRYPGPATAKFLKTFERFIDIPRTEKERLEAWGVFTSEPAEALEVSIGNTSSTEGAKEPSTVTKNSPAAAASPPPSPTNARLPPLAPLVQPQLIPPTPTKKSRLSALLSRSGTRHTTSNAITPNTRSNSHPVTASPRHSPANVLRSGSTESRSEARRRGRSSSFNDAAMIAAHEGVKATTAASPKHSGYLRPSSGSGRLTGRSGDASFSLAKQRSGSPMDSLSFDVADADMETDSKSPLSDGVAFENSYLASELRLDDTKTSVPHTHAQPVVAAAAVASTGWRVPSDITWPTAQDKGALPPTDFRNERFKLIPSITIGPWVVKVAVGATPALLGRKVVQRYFRGEDYLEIDVHVGSSVIASQVVGLCRGFAKNIVNDVGIVIQGEHEGELPEKLLAVGALNRINVNIRQKLD